MRRNYGRDRNLNAVISRDRSRNKQVFIFFLTRTLVLVAITLYCVGGAFLFIALERDHYTEQAQSLVEATIFLDGYRNFTSKKIIFTAFQNYDNTSYIEGRAMIKANLDDYHSELEYSITTLGWRKSEDNTTLTGRWSFWRSLVFCYTTITLVGYGRIVPKTDLGRILMMPYTLAGILIAMFLLTLMTTDLVWLLNAIYWRVSCFSIMRKRKEIQNRPVGKPSLTVKRMSNGLCLIEEEHADEYGIITYPHRFPWAYGIAFVVLFTLIFSALFWSWEGWTYMESVYFMWTTITTIGFGDYIPGYVQAVTFEGTMKLLVMMILIAVGLALFAAMFGGGSSIGTQEVVMYKDPYDGVYKLHVDDKEDAKRMAGDTTGFKFISAQDLIPRNELKYKP